MHNLKTCRYDHSNQNRWRNTYETPNTGARLQHNKHSLSKVNEAWNSLKTCTCDHSKQNRCRHKPPDETVTNEIRKLKQKSKKRKESLTAFWTSTHTKKQYVYTTPQMCFKIVISFCFCPINNIPM